MKPSAAPEISLHRHDAESYQVESRFSQPDSDADNCLCQGELSPDTPGSGGITYPDSRPSCQAGTVTVWDLDAYQWKARAYKLAGRNLTQS